MRNLQGEDSIFIFDDENIKIILSLSTDSRHDHQLLRFSLQQVSQIARRLEEGEKPEYLSLSASSGK
jgi:hypothetical protein